jgi:hypothetical protein
MKFTPGVSGNPKGRPPRPRAPTEAKLRGDILKASPAIIAGLIARAEEGDTGACKILLDRVLPPLRPTEPAVPLVLGDLAAATQRILEALETGIINLDQGAKLANIVGTLTRSAEAADFEARLRALEADHADRRPA